MPILELNDIIAWALIAGGCAYAAAESFGRSAAAVSAALAALAVKTMLIDVV
jgi:hypothetical protein